MLRHPVRRSIEAYQTAGDPSRRLGGVLLSFELLLRVDALLLTSDLIRQRIYGDSDLWSVLLKRHLTLGEWKLTLGKAASFVRGERLRDLAKWYKSSDRTIGELLRLRNEWAHAGHRNSPKFEAETLKKSEKALDLLISEHPELGDPREGEDGCLTFPHSGGSLEGGIFLISGRVAGFPNAVLIFSGREEVSKERCLTYESFDGARYSCTKRYGELLSFFHRSVDNLDVLVPQLPPELLLGRFLSQTSKTLERLTLQKRFRPEGVVARRDLDSKIATVVCGQKKLLIVDGPSGSGKTTWMCQFALSRSRLGQAILFETADRILPERLAENLGDQLRVRGNLSLAIEAAAAASADKRTIIAIDGVEARGHEVEFLLNLFHWIERLPDRSGLRFIVTIGSERLYRFSSEHKHCVPPEIVETFSLSPLGERSLVELAQTIPIADDQCKMMTMSRRVTVARKLARLAHGQARQPGLAARIIEMATLEISADISPCRVYEEYFCYIVGAANGEAEWPLRGRLLRILAALLLARTAYRIALEDTDLDSSCWVEAGTGRRSRDYGSLISLSVLSEIFEDFMSYVSFVDVGFFQFVASTTLPSGDLNRQIETLLSRSQHYPPALQVAAFLLGRATKARGALEVIKAVKYLGHRMDFLLLELARASGEAFIEIAVELAKTEPEQVLALMTELIRMGEPKLVEQTAAAFLGSFQFSTALSNKAIFIRAQAFYELDDHKSAEAELDKIKDIETYEISALRAEIATVRGKFSTALCIYEDLAAKYQNDGSAIRRSDALDGLGYVLGRIGENEKARHYINEAIAVLEPIGFTTSLAECYGDLGQVLTELGDIDTAHHFLGKNLLISQQLGDLIGEGVAQSLIGDAFLRQGEIEEAERRLAIGLDIARWVGNRWREAWILRRLGKLERVKGRTSEAMELESESTAILEAIGAVDH